jgi:hypothetical protein
MMTFCVAGGGSLGPVEKVITPCAWVAGRGKIEKAERQPYTIACNVNANAETASNSAT